MSSSFNLKDIERRMSGAIGVLRGELAGLRAGRAATSLVDPIMCAAYGSMTPLGQLATVSAPDPRMISVQVWDKSVVGAIEGAIRDSGLGLNPVVEGTSIRIPVPPLNEERRNELVKVANKYAENTRIAVRNVRRNGMDTLKKLEKDGDMGQDMARNSADKLQKLTDKFIADIDAMLEQKENDIITV